MWISVHTLTAGSQLPSNRSIYFRPAMLLRRREAAFEGVARLDTSSAACPCSKHASLGSELIVFIYLFITRMRPRQIMARVLMYSPQSAHGGYIVAGPSNMTILGIDFSKQAYLKPNGARPDPEDMMAPRK